MERNATGEQPGSTVATVERESSGAVPRPSQATRAGRIVIKPTTGWISLHTRDLWDYRELLFFLVWRDMKVRYTQTALGVAWVVVQPLTMMVVFALLLGRLGGLSKGTPGGVPYTVLVFAGLVPWTLFASSLAATSQSLVTNTNLITKVYFPRLILPLSSAGSFLIDFLLSTVVLLVLMAYYGIYADWRIVALPALGLFALVSAVGVGTWLTALNVRYRDIRYVVPFVVQVWLFASPVAYSTTKIPHAFRAVYNLNPMAGAIEGFRWALIGTPWRLGWLPAISPAMAVVALVTGAFYFRRVERTFADEI
jgi:homopolymeric O-antigen transport system permease protein